MDRTSLQLYRDMLRLVRHLAGRSPKAKALTSEVRTAFRANMLESDPNKIALAQQRGRQALTNYLTLESLVRDGCVALPRLPPSCAPSHCAPQQAPPPRSRQAAAAAADAADATQVARRGRRRGAQLLSVVK
jgi:hypothetical protein